jgi:hypothetical protein
MLVLDKPYVSEFLLRCAEEHGLPVLRTPAAMRLANGRSLDYMESDLTGRSEIETAAPRVLTTSENALALIADAIPDSELVAQVDLFKDKLAFRRATASLHPDVEFRAFLLEELAEANPADLPYPSVIKPAVGFFSMAVHPMFGPETWDDTVRGIEVEMAAARDIYPPSVVDGSVFIVEQMLEGDEFAVDGYFDSDGLPVILSVFRHLFASEDDVSDRVYITSKEIIEECLADFSEYLAALGHVTGCRDFPFHAELRRDGSGALRPIEVNPLRFGGWCTTADLTAQAFGLNPYLAWFRAEVPDWPAILANHAGQTYAVVVLDNSTGIDAAEIRSFDLDAVCARFEHVVEARSIDYREYPVFGFLFVRAPSSDLSELEAILTSDLAEYVNR